MGYGGRYVGERGSFSPITNQSNDRLFQAGIVGERVRRERRSTVNLRLGAVRRLAKPPTAVLSARIWRLAFAALERCRSWACVSEIG